MTESHTMPGAVLPFDPDAPPAPESRPEPAAEWEDTGAGPVYVHTDRKGRGPPDPDDPVYTLTTIRGQSGWNTDSGCPGYGLTLAEALFYRDAANAAIAAGAVFPAEGGDA